MLRYHPKVPEGWNNESDDFEEKSGIFCERLVKALKTLEVAVLEAQRASSQATTWAQSASKRTADLDTSSLHETTMAEIGVDPGETALRPRFPKKANITALTYGDLSTEGMCIPYTICRPSVCMRRFTSILFLARPRRSKCLRAWVNSAPLSLYYDVFGHQKGGVTWSRQIHQRHPSLSRP